MPTYEYKREDGTTFEIQQSINDDPLEKCPDTGQKVKRVITGGGGVVYKGSGFYVNDYKDKGPKSNGSSKASASSASDSGTSESSKSKSTADTSDS